jgi:ABC-type nickel/cobalt efflux system permease component RcnA
MRSRTVRALVVAMGAVFVVLVVAPAAFAHPLGNFTVNRGSAIRLTVGAAEVDYTIDMAEIPAYQELPAIDADGDGVASAQELDAWAQREARVILPGLDLRVDGRAVGLSSTSATAVLLPGQAGLQTLRFEGAFSGRVTTGSGSIAYQDGNADDGRIGWREVTASGDGVALAGSNVPATSPSDDLRAYPQDMLSSPLDVTSMSATFSSSATAGASAGFGPGASVDAVARPATEAAGFAGVLARRGLPLVLLGLVLAFGFGAWHALLPGHGKTLMAGAMVGSGARPRQALGVATAVASMHSAAVIALGLAVVGLQQTFRPEVLYPWLGTLSGVAAVALGGYLLWTRSSDWRHRRRHAHGHDHAHAHDRVLVLRPDGRLSRRGILTLAFAGGILPAPSALLAMLAAIQAHRVVYGLALVAAFSAGLAGALLGVGIGALRARDAIARRASERVALALPLVSAVAIVVAGLAIAVRAASAL